MVQWLRLHATNTGGTGSIPHQGTTMTHAMQYSQKIKKNFFNLKIFFPTQWGKERVGQIERVALKHITLPHTKLGSQWKFAIYDAGSSNQEI